MRSASAYLTRATGYFLLLTEDWPPFSYEEGGAAPAGQISSEAASSHHPRRRSYTRSDTSRRVGRVPRSRECEEPRGLDSSHTPLGHLACAWNRAQPLTLGRKRGRRE